MVGPRSATLSAPRAVQRELLSALSPRWNITALHFRKSGGEISASALLGLQLQEGEEGDFWAAGAPQGGVRLCFLLRLGSGLLPGALFPVVAVGLAQPPVQVPSLATLPAAPPLTHPSAASAPPSPRLQWGASTPTPSWSPSCAARRWRPSACSHSGGHAAVSYTVLSHG